MENKIFPIEPICERALRFQTTAAYYIRFDFKNLQETVLGGPYMYNVVFMCYKIIMHSFLGVNSKLFIFFDPLPLNDFYWLR